MKDQLKLLEELQRFDVRLLEADQALKTLPEKLQSLKADLAKVEAMLTKERQQLADTEKFRRDQEGQLKSDENNIAKTKAKMSQVKTGKDYMAAQREVESSRKVVAEREEEVLKLIDAIESYKKNVDAHEKDLADLRAHVEGEELATKAKLDEVVASTAGLREEREVMAKKIRPDLMKKYNFVRQRRGVAIVPVVRGVCQGCHMSIPPQLFIMLQRGNTIETCPQCNRIVYWDEILKDAELERGEQ